MDFFEKFWGSLKEAGISGNFLCIVKHWSHKAVVDRLGSSLVSPAQEILILRGNVLCLETLANFRRRLFICPYKERGWPVFQTAETLNYLFLSA